MGSLIKNTNIDQLVAELYQRTAPRFLPVHLIPPGHNFFEQMPKDSNYVCIHGYALPELWGADSSRGAGRGNANFLCVIIIFPLNVRNTLCTRCFVWTSQVVKWINKSKANSKSVIVNWASETKSERVRVWSFVGRNICFFGGTHQSNLLWMIGSAQSSTSCARHQLN